MTIEYFDSDPDGALYNLARQYPGGLPAMALRLGREVSTFKKQVSPSVFSHHISAADFSRVVELCAEARMPGAYQPLHALCFGLGHVAVQLPDCGEDAQELFQQVLLMLREEGELAKSIQGALDEHGAGGRRITKRELAGIDERIARSISALMAVREQVRAKYAADFADRG